MNRAHAARGNLSGDSMKKITLTLLTALAIPAWAQTYVQPHVNRDGTYTQGHYRSEPNSTRYDNYGARDNVYGNTNPYTGQRGSQRSEFSSPPAYNSQPGGGSNQYGGQQRKPRY